MKPEVEKPLEEKRFIHFTVLEVRGHGASPAVFTRGGIVAGAAREGESASVRKSESHSGLVSGSVSGSPENYLNPFPGRLAVT